MKENTIRDFQRSKVYKSEREDSIERGKRILNFNELRKYCEKIVSSKKFKKRFPFVTNILVKDGRGTSRATGCKFYGRIIVNFPIWSRDQLIILHEIAHGVSNDKHGGQFCENYLWLTRTFMGVEAFKRLRDSFDKNGVFYEE